jgi:hypothetical protein
LGQQIEKDRSNFLPPVLISPPQIC